MKILNVVDGSGWTGGVEQAFLLSRELCRLGADARLAVHGRNPVFSEAVAAGVQAYVYDKDGWGSLRRTMNILRILGDGYDFAVGHKPAAVRQLIIPLTLFYRRTEFVGVRRVSFKVSRATVYRFPRRIVTVAASVRSILVESGLNSEKMTVIPSGVDIERFRPSAEERAAGRNSWRTADRPVILNLAKFVPEQKGQLHLLKAVKDLRERWPLKLFLAGLETDGREARQAVRKYGLEGEVELLGFRRDIPELINMADVFVFPSLPGLDAIAGSVLQAMACGGVVVVSDVGGISEYLRDGENGFLVPPGDVERLRNAIEKALSLPWEERKRIGHCARQTILQGYSAQGMAEAYLGVFREMRGKDSADA